MNEGSGSAEILPHDHGPDDARHGDGSDEANEETIDGTTHMVYEGTYYRPFMSEGETIYMVVEDPR